MAQKATLVRIQGKTDWQVIRTKSGEWVAVCPTLSLTVHSETWSELMEDIADTLDMMLSDLVKENEFDKFMRDRGWTLLVRLPHPSEPMRFEIPFVTSMADRDTALTLR